MYTYVVIRMTLLTESRLTRQISKQLLIKYGYNKKFHISKMCTESDNESSRPVTPSEEDCCHNACDPCIFDVHRQLLEEYYKRRKQNIKIQSNENLLCSYLYRNFAVTNVKEISDCYILLSLKYQGRKI